MHNTRDTELMSFKVPQYLPLSFEALVEEKEPFSFDILVRSFTKLLCSLLSLKDFVFPFLSLAKQTYTSR